MKRAKLNFTKYVMAAALLPVLLAAVATAQAQPGTNTSQTASTNASPPGLSEFSVQINDGFGRPVPAVAVEVFRFAKPTNGDEVKIVLGKAVSDGDGLARGLYDKASIPTNGSFLVALSKSGYAGVTAAPQINYTINRLYHSNDVARIAKLTFANLNAELPELLAGEMDSPKASLADLVFAHESELQPALKRIVDDPYVGRQAAELLAYIGNPDDVRLLLGDAFTPNGNPAVNRWADAVASALLAPTTEREWSFLKSCAMDDFGDHWVDLAGIRTLRLIATPKSLQMLKDVRDVNPARTNEIDSAIAYINSHPPPLADRSLAIAADKTAQALGAGSWLGNERPRYNLNASKALVDLNIVSNGTRYQVYTATFHLDGNLWKLRGVRVTKDTLLPEAPNAKKVEAAR